MQKIPYKTENMLPAHEYVSQNTCDDTKEFSVADWNAIMDSFEKKPLMPCVAKYGKIQLRVRM